MPAKACPSCGLKNPASAAICDCGQSFGGARLVGTAELICRRCGKINEPTATACGCGYSFLEDPEKMRKHLTQQLRASRVVIAAGLLMIAMGAALFVLSIPSFGGFLLTPSGIAVFLKGSRNASRAHAALDTLDPSSAGVPVARVLQK